MSELISQLVEITGLDAKAAEYVLQINDNNLEQAIHYHLEGGSSTFTNSVASSIIPEAGLDMPILCDDENINSRPTTSNSRRRPINHNNNNNNNNNNKRNGTDNKVILSEQAALPKSVVVQDQRLDEDGVRAPIPAKREQLLLPEEDQFSFSYAQTARRQRRPNITTIPFRNFAREAEMQEAELTANRTATIPSPLLVNQENNVNNEFKYSMMGPPGIPAKRPKRLEDIFRPPVDILFFGGMQAAREHATNMNRWLLINLQDSYEFKSQVLNRDVWSDKRVRQIVTDYFILYQLMVDNPDGARFKVFYKIDEVPYVGIIDPRTGEEQLQIHVTTPQKLCESLRVFLNENGLRLDPSKVQNSSATSSSSEPCSSKSVNNENGNLGNSRKSQELSKIKKTLELSEEEQLRLAIQNSLEDQPDCEYRGYVSASSGDEESPEGDEGEDSEVVITGASRTDDPAVKSKCLNYKDYFGSDTDPLTKIQLRLPDGEREQLEWPSSTKLLAIKVYILQKYSKFEMKLIKLITTYPRQNILELNQELTLNEAKLHPTSILYLHIDE